MSETKKSMLIFGISSFLGSNIAESFKDDYKVVGTYFNNPVKSPNIMTLKCDITNLALVKGIVNLVKPDIVFYCVGLNDVYECHEDAKLSDSLNTNGVFNVVSSLDSFNSKFIFFSSAQVFSGSDSIHIEEDSPIPSTTYGSSLSSSEFYIQKSYLNYLIFRLPKVYGLSASTKLNFFEKLQYAFFNREDIKCSTNSLSTYISIYDLIDSIRESFNQNLANLTLHLSGNELATEEYFSKVYKDVFNESGNFVSPSHKNFPVIISTNSLNLRNGKYVFVLNSDKAQKLINLKLKTIKESLVDYKKSLSKEKKVQLKLI